MAMVVMMIYLTEAYLAKMNKEGGVSMTESRASEDTKIMNKIREILAKGKDVQVRTDKEGQIKVYAYKPELVAKA